MVTASDYNGISAGTHCNPNGITLYSAPESIVFRPRIQRIPHGMTPPSCPLLAQRWPHARNFYNLTQITINKKQKLMKKIFTLIAMALVAVGVNAQTLIDFSVNQTGITLGGTTEVSQVKLKTNTTNTTGIKFANGYTTDEVLNANNAKLSVDGGFKTGDKITIAGAYNNSASKNSKIDIFIKTATGYEVLFTTDQFINGRLVNNDPVEQTFTLTADADEIYLGRNGNTATFVTTLKVVRGTETLPDPTAATTWNFEQALSTNDVTNLTADTDLWVFDTDNNYWKSAGKLAERNVFTPLKANGVELELTAGLLFTRDNSEGLGADRVRISPAKFLAFNGSLNMISLGNLVKDDVIKIKFKGAGESERTLNGANVTVTDGSLTTSDTDVHEATMTVVANGAVSFTTSNGFQIFAITINAALPTTTAIDAVATEVEAADAPAYNLQGQPVDESYRGVVIQNGKKVVRK